MNGYEAKKAGSFASQIMKKNKITWVTFNEKKMEYRALGKSDFYLLIRKAMREKLAQNSKARQTLLATGNLTLLPDHHQKSNVPLAWRYYDIYMEFREMLSSNHK